MLSRSLWMLSSYLLKHSLKSRNFKDVKRKHWMWKQEVTADKSWHFSPTLNMTQIYMNACYLHSATKKEEAVITPSGQPKQPDTFHIVGVRPKWCVRPMVLHLYLCLLVFFYKQNWLYGHSTQNKITHSNNQSLPLFRSNFYPCMFSLLYVSVKET